MRLARLIPILVLMFLLPMLAGCTRTARTASPQPNQAPSRNAQQVDVDLGEWYVKLDPSTVNAGTVQFDIRNVGERLHSLRIERGEFEEASRNLEPGESTTMTVDLKPGTYEADCPIGNHEERGMVTSLTVK